MDIRIREKASAFFKVTTTTFIENLEFVCNTIIKKCTFFEIMQKQN